MVTIDPRGSGRNPAGTSPITPEQHAADLHRVIEALGVGPVDAFGSSGGAVCLLALLDAHPDDVRRAVVHEPPFVDVLEDGAVVLAAATDISDTYQRAGNGPAMAKFIALVMQPEPLPDDYLDRPAPDPAAFGMSADDDGDRTSPLIRNMGAFNSYVPDYDALTAMGDRVHVAVGAGIGPGDRSPRRDTVSPRGSGRPVDVVPSHHAGFTGAERAPPG